MKRRLRSTTLSRWLLPVGGLLALIGYFGPWVDHRVAGLVVTGLDLGEYVKFLPGVRGGEVIIWRHGFYLPLLAVSLACALSAYHRQLHYGWTIRTPLLAAGAIAAFNMLPPAWTPARMLTPEFRLQVNCPASCCRNWIPVSVL